MSEGGGVGTAVAVGAGVVAVGEGLVGGVTEVAVGAGEVLVREARDALGGPCA